MPGVVRLRKGILPEVRPNLKFRLPDLALSDRRSEPDPSLRLCYFFKHLVQSPDFECFGSHPLKFSQESQGYI